jgi:hypothetical protein
MPRGFARSGGFVSDRTRSREGMAQHACSRRGLAHRGTGFLSSEAAAAMLALEHGGFTSTASVRNALIDHDMPSYFQSLEHQLR